MNLIASRLLCLQRIRRKMAVLAWLIGIFITLLIFLLYKIWQNLHYWQSRGIPCDPPHLLFGNFGGPQSKKGLAEILSDYYKKFKGTGPFVGFYFLHRPTAFLLDIDLIKKVLIKDFSNFANRGRYCNEADDPITGHLFTLDGPKWKFMRTKLSPTFTSGKMKFMFPTVVAVGYNFVNAFDELLHQSSIVEVKELMARYTIDVIGTCAFGIECNSLKDPGAEFRIMGKKIFTDLRYGRIGFAFFTSFPKLASRFHLKFTPDHIEEFIMRVVKETVEYREQNNIRRNDFMNMLIDLKNNNFEIEDKSRALTINEVAAQVFIFFAAGFETSSTTLGFILYELARHQDIQQRVREEINTIVQKHDNQLTYECLNEFVYLGQIISETLRLYTVLPFLNRECLEDYPIPGFPGYVIEKGTFVVIPSGAIHRDSDYYPNPDVFNPDNFSPDKVNNRENVLALAFGEGPRNCIGLRFGQMQMRIGLALLLQAFKFSFCEKTPKRIEYDSNSFLLSSLGGMYLKVERV